MVQGAWIFMLEADYVWMRPMQVCVCLCMCMFAFVCVRVRVCMCCVRTIFLLAYVTS